MSVKNRISLIIETLEISRYRFSKTTGISESTIKKLAEGVNEPSAEVLRKMLRTYRISANWVLEGIEPIFLPDNHNSESGNSSFNAQRTSETELLLEENLRLKKEIQNLLENRLMQLKAEEE